MIGLGKVAPLMYLMGKRLDELTMLDFQRVATVFDIKVDITNELKEAGLALLRGENIHTVADMVKSPESVAQLMNLLRGKGVHGSLAEAEIDDMYSSTSMMYTIEDDGEIPQPQEPPVNSNRLIAPSSVGWRLPG